MRARTAVSFEDAGDRTKPEKAAVVRSAPLASASISAVALQDSGVLLALIAIALWAITHSYQGIFGDTNVYVGRALADLDQGGIGRDVMFVNDGQSRFSLFPLLLDRLIGTLGTPGTVLLLALLAMTAWMSALAFFARQYVAWRLVPVVVIFVAVLPTFVRPDLAFRLFGNPERAASLCGSARPRCFGGARRAAVRVECWPPVARNVAASNSWRSPAGASSRLSSASRIVVGCSSRCWPSPPSSLPPRWARRCSIGSSASWPPT